MDVAGRMAPKARYQMDDQMFESGSGGTSLDVLSVVEDFIRTSLESRLLVGFQDNDMF